MLYLVTAPSLSPPVHKSPSGLSLSSRAPRGLLSVATHVFLVLSGHRDPAPAPWCSPRKRVGTLGGWKCGGHSQACARVHSKPIKSASLRRGGTQAKLTVRSRYVHLPGSFRRPRNSSASLLGGPPIHRLPTVYIMVSSFLKFFFEAHEWHLDPQPGPLGDRR